MPKLEEHWTREKGERQAKWFQSHFLLSPQYLMGVKILSQCLTITQGKYSMMVTKGPGQKYRIGHHLLNTGSKSQAVSQVLKLLQLLSFFAYTQAACNRSHRMTESGNCSEWKKKKKISLEVGQFYVIGL